MPDLGSAAALVFCLPNFRGAGSAHQARSFGDPPSELVCSLPRGGPAPAAASLRTASLRASTAQRAGEPAWHRRQRRARGNARALVRIAAAARLLGQHHSAQRSPMPNAQKGRGAGTGKGGGGGGGGKSGNGGNGSQALPGDWACHICKVQANRDWRERCRSCHAYRSVEMERAFAEQAQRQSQQQRRSTQQQQHQRQQQQRLQEKKNDEDRRSLRQQLERLQSELAAVKSQQLQSTGAADEEGDDDMADDNGYSSWTAEERTKRIDLAKGALAYAIARHGEESDQAQEHRDEISALQKACREAKPFKSHRNLLERRRDELRRKQERDEANITSTKEEIAELQEKLSTLQAAVEERSKQLKQVNEELSVIVRKALEEEGAGESDEGGKPPCGQACAPWSALASAVTGLAGQPGIPDEIAKLLIQVQQVASAFSATAATAQANPGGAGSYAAAAAAAAASPPTDAKPRTTAPTSPVILAPHGRFGKAATAARSTPPPPPRPQPTTPSTPTDASGGGGAEGGATTTGSDGTSTADGAGSAAATAAGEEKGRPHDGSDAELVEDDADDGGAAPMDIEQSIAKLPDVDQRRIRAALRGGATRGQRKGDGGGDSGDEEGGRRERERSPRPTKHNDKDL